MISVIAHTNTYSFVYLVNYSLALKETDFSQVTGLHLATVSGLYHWLRCHCLHLAPADHPPKHVSLYFFRHRTLWLMHPFLSFSESVFFVQLSWFTRNHWQSETGTSQTAMLNLVPHACSIKNTALIVFDGLNVGRCKSSCKSFKTSASQTSVIVTSQVKFQVLRPSPGQVKSLH